MKKLNTKMIALNAIIAAVYAAFTILLAPISYGSIQMRISEIMIFLAFYNKDYIPGLVLGCLIANIPSGLGAFDMVFGTFATLLAVIAMWKLDNKYLAALVGGLINGVIVGLELKFALGLPFIASAASVFAGEFAVLVIGAIIFTCVQKNETIIKYIKS